MTNEEAKTEINKVFEPAFANYIITALTEWATLSERKTGKWFDSVDKYDAMANKHNYFCQECKSFAMDFVSGTEDWWCNRMPNYCPNCGAKMEGAEE